MNFSIYNFLFQKIKEFFKTACSSKSNVNDYNFPTRNEYYQKSSFDTVFDRNAKISVLEQESSNTNNQSFLEDLTQFMTKEKGVSFNRVTYSVNSNDVYAKTNNSYPNVRQDILRSINLDILPGEVFCLLGPALSGKTTLVGLLSFILKPTRGNFWSYGFSDQKSIKVVKNSEKPISNICLKENFLWEELTVYDNFHIILILRGFQGDQSEIDELIDKQ